MDDGDGGDKRCVGVAKVAQQHVDFVTVVGKEGKDAAVKALKLKWLAVKAHHVRVC